MGGPGCVTPVLRSFDELKAREFYVDFLGFKVVFEHRFGDNFPLYLGIEREGALIHLSEHHGDASPAAQVRIETADVVGYARALRAKDYRNAKPGDPEEMPWGSLELRLTDPFHNVLVFHQPKA